MGENAVSVKVKKAWKKSGKTVPLRLFAKKLVADGDPLGQAWFDNKDGACNQERTVANVNRGNLERQATKLNRKKTKAGGKAS
jgi:hypothetical protein